MADTAAQVIGYGAAVVSCVQLVPQVVRTVRTRTAAGVAPMMWVLIAAQTVVWLAYGTSEGLWPSVAVNVVLVGCCAAMLRTLRALRVPGTDRALRLLGVLLVAEVALVALAPMSVVGAVAGVLSAGVFYPQVVAVLRSDDLSGLSRPTWWITLLTGALWFSYGLVVHSVATWGSAAHNAVLTVVVLGRLLLVDRAARTDVDGDVALAA